MTSRDASERTMVQSDGRATNDVPDVTVQEGDVMMDDDVT